MLKWGPPIRKILIEVADKRVLRSKGKEMIESEESCVMRSFTICDLRQVLFGVLISRNVRWGRHIARMR
jgi:hypothetical protein